MKSRVEEWSSHEGLANLLATTPVHRLPGFKIARVDVAGRTLAIGCPTRGAAERSDGAQDRLTAAR